MCIRDSQESYRPFLDVFESYDALSVSLHTSGPLMEWLETCLLYTSDAADDLLCVDLGGRRIIKKKTT